MEKYKSLFKENDVIKDDDRKQTILNILSSVEDSIRENFEPLDHGADSLDPYHSIIMENLFEQLDAIRKLI